MESPSQRRLFLGLTILIGATVGAVTVAFLVLTERLGTRLYPPEGAQWRRVIVPLVGTLMSGWLLARYFPEARGSGIPQTKVALFARNGYISLRTACGKFLCCAVSLASGIALGREGPSVQIGAGIASTIGRRLRLDPSKVRDLIPIGAAAALAAAFNTPIAAVLFTLEEVVGDMQARVLGSVVMSAATSWVVLHLFLGDEPLFHVPAYRITYNWEFGVYALLGVLGGLVSAAFVRLLLWIRTYYLASSKHVQSILPGAGGLFVGLLALALPQVLGVGYDIVGQALNGKMIAQTMLILLVLKVVACAVCYSSGNAGGIFGPSLFFGAMIGGALGDLFQRWLPGFTGATGAYALVGMGTTFAGVLRVPFTSVIMIFELTRDYNIIVPLMISNLISYFISSRLQHKQIYQALAEQDGIHLPEPEADDASSVLLVADAMRPPLATFPPQTTVADFRRQVSQGGCLIAEGSILWGVVSAHDVDAALNNGSAEKPLRALLPTAPAAYERLRATDFPHVHLDQPLDLALHRMGGAGLELVPVVERTNPRLLVGVVTLDDLLRTYRVRSASP